MPACVRSRANPTADGISLTAVSSNAPRLRDRRRVGWPDRLATWCLVALLVFHAQAASRADEASGPFFRIFLTDGTTLVSYGDFAQVGDRVVFSLPVGAAQGEPRLHLSSIPADSVDWPTTERYREATRAAQYARTRGEEDFAILSSEVASVLNDIALTDDPQRRLALANDARARLVAWPVTHFGYRADEIRQILTMIEEVISDLRAAAGESRFDLSFVAGLGAAPNVVPLPPPSLQESILQALWASRLAESPAERLALLQAARTALDINAPSLPAAWVTSTRQRALGQIDDEVRVAARLQGLRTRALAAADQMAARADVRGVERLLQGVRGQTSSFAADRHGEVQALLETLEARLDATRRLRLARDQYLARAGIMKDYQRAIDRPLRVLTRERAALDDIRTLAGPSADTLIDLDKRLARSAKDLARIIVPADGQAIHAVATSAVQLAANAVRLRRTAVASGNMQQAWDASAAAAGALLLLDRARDDISRLLRPPVLP